MLEKKEELKEMRAAVKEIKVARLEKEWKRLECYLRFGVYPEVGMNSFFYMNLQDNYNAEEIMNEEARGR